MVETKSSAQFLVYNCFDSLVPIIVLLILLTAIIHFFSFFFSPHNRHLLFSGIHFDIISSYAFLPGCNIRRFRSFLFFWFLLLTKDSTLVYILLLSFPFFFLIFFLFPCLDPYPFLVCPILILYCNMSRFPIFSDPFSAIENPFVTVLDRWWWFHPFFYPVKSRCHLYGRDLCLNLLVFDFCFTLLLILCFNCYLLSGQCWLRFSIDSCSLLSVNCHDSWEL